MSRKELESMKVADLKKICKERGVKHYHGKNCFKKDEMVEAILKAENETESSSNVEETAKNKTKESARAKQVEMYIENAKVNTVVAFRLPNGKVKSAKIVKRSTINRKFMLETEYGAQYVVPFNNIIWVKTGKKWPRGVYKLLKGMVDSGCEY